MRRSGQVPGRQARVVPTSIHGASPGSRSMAWWRRMKPGTLAGPGSACARTPPRRPPFSTARLVPVRRAIRWRTAQFLYGCGQVADREPDDRVRFRSAPGTTALWKSASISRACHLSSFRRILRAENLTGIPATTPSGLRVGIIKLTPIVYGRRLHQTQRRRPHMPRVARIFVGSWRLILATALVLGGL
jgi:hypothetical protein